VVRLSPVAERSMISQWFFQNNMMYQHGILRVNYTTYDVRCAQDTINHRRNISLSMAGEVLTLEDPGINGPGMI
jgi:hypothetical protein